MTSFFAHGVKLQPQVCCRKRFLVWSDILFSCFCQIVIMKQLTLRHDRGSLKEFLTTPRAWRNGVLVIDFPAAGTIRGEV